MTPEKYNYGVKTFDLSVARDNEEIWMDADFIGVQSLDADKDVILRLDNRENPRIILNVSRANHIKHKVRRAYLTNTAESGKTLELLLGGNFWARLMDPQVTTKSEIVIEGYYSQVKGVVAGVGGIENLIIKPPVGELWELLAFELFATDIAGSAGNHQFDIYFYDDTNGAQVAMFEVLIVGTSMIWLVNGEAPGHTIKPADATSFNNMLSTIKLTSNSWINVRYTNDTDTATTLDVDARRCNIMIKKTKVL